MKEIRKKASEKKRWFLFSILTILVSIVAGNIAWAAPFAYTKNDTGTVSVIDTSTNTVVATVNTSGGYGGVAVNPSGSRVYVASFSDNTISVIDTSTNTVVGTIVAGSGPHGVAVNPSGSRVYVANHYINTVSVIDASTNTVVYNIAVGLNPTGVAVNPSGNCVYVTNFGDNTVSVIDTSTNTVVYNIAVGSNPHGVAVNPSGSRVYVANFYGETVSVIDASTNTVVYNIAVGVRPIGVAVNPSGSRVYVANVYSGTVSVIDTSINTVVATVNVESNPEALAVNPSGRRVYVESTTTVSVIDTNTNTVVDTIAVGNGGQGCGKFIGPGECAQAPAGLVSWWKGDGNANDNIGSNHGTLVNGATFAAGKVDNAFNLDGVDDYIEIPSSSLFDFGIGDFTINAWIYPKANGDVPIISRLWGWDFRIGWPSGGREPDKLFFFNSSGTGFMVSNTVSLNQWHHVAVSRKDGVLYGYLDGVEYNAGICTDTINAPPNTFLTLGKHLGYATPPFYGMIDEVEIFNRGLTHEEINAIYYAGSAGTCYYAGSPLCDFNGDGKPDILWRNTSTGGNYVWYMSGAKGSTRASGVRIETVVDLNWKIVGTGDFNGDGKPDILWRNTSTGQNYVWYMRGVNGATRASGSWIEIVADLSWTIVGAGDFNSEGKPDILWRNTATGQNYVWYMNGANGATRASGAWIETVADLNWKIVGTGDFNSDGKRDILWRNTATGGNYVWYMSGANGATRASGAWIETVADLNWEIVNH